MAISLKILRKRVQTLPHQSLKLFIRDDSWNRRSKWREVDRELHTRNGTRRKAELVAPVSQMTPPFFSLHAARRMPHAATRTFSPLIPALCSCAAFGDSPREPTESRRGVDSEGDGVESWAATVRCNCDWLADAIKVPRPPSKRALISEFCCCCA